MKRLLIFIVALSLTAAAEVQRSSMKGHPVTIVQRTVATRTLADGTNLTTVSEESFYRNAQGLFRSDTTVPLMQGRKGFMHISRIVDSDAKEYTGWTTYDDRPEANGIQHDVIHTVTQTDTSTTQPHSTIKMERLGDGEVAGYPCMRTRFTITNPVDTHGNDRPYAVVQETCESSVYGVLSQTLDDPVSGKRVTTLQSLTPGEPDATIFQPPADMQVLLRKQQQ